MNAATTAVPSSEALDLALEAFFRRRSDDPGALQGVRHERITGGYSRLMLRVWVQDGRTERGYIVRADPPPGESIVESDRAAEWALLTALRAADSIPVPAAIWFDPTGEELGAPAIVSEMIDGPSLLSMAARAHPAERFAMAQPLAQLATRIHRFDLAALPPHLDRPASWDAYVESRIQLWIDAARRLPEPDPFMRAIARWLEANKPDPVPLGLVHGDFQPANVVVDPDGAYHVIDWELAHIGDPREDLGWFTLCAINQPPSLIADDSRAFYLRYAELMGLPPSAVDPAAIAYFTILGSTDVFLRVADRLAMFARGDASSALLAYMADGQAAMQSVFMRAVTDHAEARRVSA
jgi:aminoglycoside phosphotransferase (APT) family kinase protein